MSDPAVASVDDVRRLENLKTAHAAVRRELAK